MIIALQILILFRESVLTLLNGLLSPFFTQLVRKLSGNGLVPMKEDIEEHVFADFDDEGGVVFFPPVNAQRYAAVCDCLMDERWFGKLEKVLNIGKHYDINFMKYLTEVSGVTQILGLDIACSLNCPCDILALPINSCDRWGKPLQITLLQGNAADPDYRLIGCDAVIGVEIIQKLLPHDLDKLVHNVFGFIKPWVALFTTPNADFNCLLKNLDNNGLRQSDHYFEWRREQLHDWCSNIVRRYPEYMVMSRGVGPGPPGTSHYGCFSQLVLFISKHYVKEMDINVNSLVMISNLPDPEQVSDIGFMSPISAASAHSMFHIQLESETPELLYTRSQSSTEDSMYLSSITGTTQSIETSVQCDIDVEHGKKFVMFDDDEIYQIRMARRSLCGNVYEIGDVARRLNNTMYDVKQFSKTTQYLMEKNEINSKDMMEEILQLTEKLSCKINLSSGDKCHVWNNVNWGENVPYWNQYYKVVGVYNFPYEGRSEDDMILEILSEETSKLFDKHVQGGNLGIPVEVLMNSVKHITDDVERVMRVLRTNMLMEDSGYELEGGSVVCSGVNVSEESNNDEAESNSNTDSESNGSSSGRDFSGRLFNRALGRKIKMLRLMLPEEDDIRQALCLVVCRLKKIAMSSGPRLHGPARSKWLQTKFLELLNLTYKSILRRKLRNNDKLKLSAYDKGDEIAMNLSRIKAEDDITMQIVKKYENLLRTTAGNSDILSQEQGSTKSLPPKFAASGENINDGVCQLKVVKENYDLSTLNTLDDQHIQCIEDREDKNMSVSEEETKDTTIKIYSDIISPIQSAHSNSPQERTVKTKVNSTKKNISNSSNSRIRKKKSKHSATFLAVKRSMKNTRSVQIIDITNDSGINRQERVLNKIKFDNTIDCIDNIRKKMGPTLVLSIPSKPIPDSFLQLCHPELHQKTIDRFQNISYSWDETKDAPVAATEHSQRVEILSHSETQIVTLQRMIGTDPDVDAEIYEADLELSDSASLINDTSYFARDDIPCAVHVSSVIMLPEESTTVRNAVEIITQDGRVLIDLQRSIGTSPDVDTEVYEQELGHSKLTTSLSNMVSFENIPAGFGNVSSQEFFLYDLNEPTTSKGIRNVNMDVQCGTEAQISATTSFTSPLKMHKASLEYKATIYDVPAVLKNDCVTSTHDILKSCDSNVSPWMKSVGIKIKDSNHQITHTSNEIATGHEAFTFVGNETGLNTQPARTPECNVLETFHSNVLVQDNHERTPTKINKIRPNNTNNLRNLNEIRKKEYNRTSVQFLHVPRAKPSKLSCGGVHVHSYKNFSLVSEDVVYQGEWQRHRRCNVKKSNLPFKEKLNLTRKTNVPPKPVASPIKKSIGSAIKNPIVPPIKKSIKLPIKIRNTKANMMKEARTKMYMETKLGPTKHEVHKNRFNRQATKVTYNSTVSSKTNKEKSSKLTQPPRYTRFVQKPTTLNEKTIPTILKRKRYIPSYLEKIKKQQIIKGPSNIEDKTGDKLNASKVNNEQIPSKLSLSKVDDPLCALYKVSVELPKDMNYVVYRNKIDTSHCSNAIENLLLTSIPSSEENILRRKLSNRSHDTSYSSLNKGSAALNPLITNLDPIQSKRQTTLIKSNLKRKGSNSKIASRIKKLTNIMFSKKSQHNLAKEEYLLENSGASQNRALEMPNVDVFDRQANDFTSSKGSIKSSLTNLFDTSESENSLSLTDNNKKYTDKPDSRIDLVLDCSKSKIQDFYTDSLLDCSEAESDTHESTKTQILVMLPSKSTDRVPDSQVLSDPTESTNETNQPYEYANNLFNAMKELVEECLSFDNNTIQYNTNDDSSKLIVNRMIENADSTHSDSDNINSIGSETYMTSSSFRRPYNGRSSESFTHSIDFSFKSQTSALKKSESTVDGSWHNIAMPSQHGSEVKFENKDTISITRNPRADLAFSTFSVNTQPSPLELGQQPDYVNLVDSETGSRARTNRRATSEEVLVSDRSSESYVSCVLDDDAAIPSWMYNANQQASSSFSSSRYVAVTVPESEYDVNGNELTAHGAGAGDGCGIHSDISQDSSGQGTSFSSSGSSRVHSESVVVEPASFLAGFAPNGEQPNASVAAVAEEAIHTLDVASSDSQNGLATRSRIPRPVHRISLPASDADISSLDTDVASD